MALCFSVVFIVTSCLYARWSSETSEENEEGKGEGSEEKAEGSEEKEEPSLISNVESNEGKK